jgi:hypothetical protein
VELDTKVFAQERSWHDDQFSKIVVKQRRASTEPALHYAACTWHNEGDVSNERVRKCPLPASNAYSRDIMVARQALPR